MGSKMDEGSCALFFGRDVLTFLLSDVTFFCGLGDDWDWMVVPLNGCFKSRPCGRGMRWEKTDHQIA